MSTNGTDPIQSVTMMKTGENSYRPSKPSEKTDYQHQSTGLTKREYFAALALSGCLASPLCTTKYEVIIKDAITCADELIKQLNESEVQSA